MPRHRRGWGMQDAHGVGDRHSPITVSMLEPVLLILINEKPRHGYTLLADLAAFGMGTIHPSMVYRTLREMEDLEWIQSEWDKDQTQGPPRRTYQLTPQGEAALEYWRLELEKTRDLISTFLTRVNKS